MIFKKKMLRLFYIGWKIKNKTKIMKKIQISVQVLKDKELIKEVRNYAKIRSIQQQKINEATQLPKKVKTTQNEK